MLLTHITSNKSKWEITTSKWGHSIIWSSDHQLFPKKIWPTQYIWMFLNQVGTYLFKQVFASNHAVSSRLPNLDFTATKCWGSYKLMEKRVMSTWNFCAVSHVARTYIQPFELTAQSVPGRLSFQNVLSFVCSVLKSIYRDESRLVEQSKTAGQAPSRECFCHGTARLLTRCKIPVFRSCYRCVTNPLSATSVRNPYGRSRHYRASQEISLRFWGKYERRRSHENRSGEKSSSYVKYLCKRLPSTYH